jgi:hypothetical protein
VTDEVHFVGLLAKEGAIHVLGTSRPKWRTSDPTISTTADALGHVPSQSLEETKADHIKRWGGKGSSKPNLPLNFSQTQLPSLQPDRLLNV